MNPPYLGHPNSQIPFFFFVHEKEGNALGVLTQKHGDHQRPLGYYGQQLDPVVQGYPPCLRLVATTALWLRPQRKLLWDPLYPSLYPMQSKLFWILITPSIFQ